MSMEDRKTLSETSLNKILIITSNDRILLLNRVLKSSDVIERVRHVFLEHFVKWMFIVKQRQTLQLQDHEVLLLQSCVS